MRLNRLSFAVTHEPNRRRTMRSLALLISLTALLAGCTAATPSPTPALAPAEPIATPSASPSPTTVPSPTPTALPTATPTQTPAPTEVPLEMEFSVSANAAEQGQTVQLNITCNQSCQTDVTWDERTIQTFAVDESHAWAALAAHALAEPGMAFLTVGAQTSTGQRVEMTSPLPIVAGEFEAETLTFDETTQALLDPEISQAENALMNELFAVYSPQRLWDGPFVWPWDGPVTSFFGTRRNYQGIVQSFHTGIDLDGVTGDPITACARGVVILAEPLQVRGNAVVLNHGAGVFTAYFHLSEIDVTEGQIVDTGDVLGLMGSTGLSTGSHVHWEVRVGGIAVNPEQWTEETMGPARP